MANGLEGVNGTARPRLLRLPSGPILLAGGRYTKDPSRWTSSWAGRIAWDPALWINHEGDGVKWEMHSLSYWHNRLTPNESLRFTGCVNNTSPSCAPICAPNCKITRCPAPHPPPPAIRILVQCCMHDRIGLMSDARLSGRAPLTTRCSRPATTRRW